MGILANHVPIMGVLKPGRVGVFEDKSSKMKSFLVSSGIFFIGEKNQLNITCEEAVAIEDASNDKLAQINPAENLKDLLDQETLSEMTDDEMVEAKKMCQDIVEKFKASIQAK